MASLYRKPCVTTALSDENYKSNGLWNKYAERLDQCDFFVGCGKKNGAVDYCAIAYCYWLFENVITDDGNTSDDDRKYMVHYAMYQSDVCCTSAGCTQQANKYKDNSAWSDDWSELCVGFQVFFKRSNGAIYHTGMCVDWDDEGLYVMEANVDSYHTRKRYYKFSNPKLAGFGIPRFDGYEISGAKDEDPAPVASPEKPRIAKYEVCVNSFLNVRLGPGTSYKSIWKLYNGDKVKIYKIQDGFGRIDDYGWVSMDYLKEV
jgi:hypothetical protein